MLRAIIDNLKGLYSLLVGLSITGRFLLSPQRTVHYPRQVVAPESLASFRGPLELVPSADDPAKTRCISCQMCVRACPDNCLKVVKGEGGKAPAVWVYDFSLCCLCAACVEACPASALRFSHKVYLTALTRDELKLDLLADLKARAAKAAGGADARPPAQPPAGLEPQARL
ncbi:MAG: 4Fe-4S binding protein [Deltaproteobacteria bacterium]|jgi:NADH-quinone oxidoreductase subunit I|nr:4Fe-4S binding protein [Deltaproteobacteria bacterium]